MAFQYIPGLQVIELLRESAVTGDKEALQRLITEFKEVVNMKDQNGCSLLKYAVLGDNPDCVAQLLLAGVNINEVDNIGRTALHWAAYIGSYECVKLLLLNEANWELKDAEGATPLHMASQKRSSKCLALLLKYLGQQDVDAQDCDKRTALHWSACCGYVENVKLLIKHKANAGNPDVEGKTPIHWAASSHCPDAAECVKVLLESAPLAINWLDRDGRGALHFAIADGAESTIFELVSSKYCEINLTDNLLHTPIHLAAYFGFTSSVKLLLDKDALCSSPDINKATPLHYAALNSSSDTVELLLTRTFDVDLRDNCGCSAFMWAAGKAAIDVMQSLIIHGADIQATDQHGSSALHIAAVSGHVNTIVFLLKNQALIDATDDTGRTALLHACEIGHLDAVSSLLNGGASCNLTDREGKAALHWASIGGHRSICKILLCQHSASLDAADLQGRTPLFYATFGGYDDCILDLIKCNADLLHFDLEGYTALHWACKQGHLNAVKSLMTGESNPSCLTKAKSRCTALDLAMLGDHHDIARYLLDNGGVSIHNIINSAAIKIQALYRGFRVRNDFSATLLMNRSVS